MYIDCSYINRKRDASFYFAVKVSRYIHKTYMKRNRYNIVQDGGKIVELVKVEEKENVELTE